MQNKSKAVARVSGTPGRPAIPASLAGLLAVVCLAHTTPARAYDGVWVSGVSCLPELLTGDNVYLWEGVYNGQAYTEDKEWNTAHTLLCRLPVAEGVQYAHLGLWATDYDSSGSGYVGVYVEKTSRSSGARSTVCSLYSVGQHGAATYFLTSCSFTADTDAYVYNLLVYIYYDQYSTAAFWGAGVYQE